MFSLNNGGIIGCIEFSGTAWFYVTYVAFLLVTIVASYLLGSINSAIIVSKVIYRDDVRKHGSGNPGLTNTLRTYGKGAAGLVLLGDMMKTAISIFIAGLLFGFGYINGVSLLNDGMCFVAGLFSVLGHIFPIYYNFKGGKGVLSTATMALIVSPVPFLILLLIFILIVAASKYVSLASVSVAALYPILIHSFVKLFAGNNLPGLLSLSAIILAVLIVWRHKDNLKRISDRTERKISFKKKPEFKADADEGEEAAGAEAVIKGEEEGDNE